MHNFTDALSVVLKRYQSKKAMEESERHYENNCGLLLINKINEWTEKRKTSQTTLRIIINYHFQLAEGQLISIYTILACFCGDLFDTIN
jgi:hypothetical protein